MKRLTLLFAILVVVVAALPAAAERSPDSSHVTISPVPQTCLASGAAVKGGYKYTCNKVDSSDVWNDVEADSFQKDIYEAFRTQIVSEPAASRIGLVVKQDSVYTRPSVVQAEKNETAYVEQRKQSYKYHYAKK